ncbi:plasmalemma vesicle associated protein a isoform X2 [Toxotes jaculatrix]|uniref:plasmalemma vesicle associated protein a isoform X2 n=1 Tax=Toxotes jaculatrix TaxID=941984 RepID=UPI001B3B03C0|nr:plasmalemma vesicle associated protein a isoform X2 [Toxotes jaculatrix]
MISSGYSHVSRQSLEAKKRMQYHSKGKSCGYYMRIVFFFSSLIQSLIIVSLVLFLVYGKKQDSPSTARIQDLEESFSRLSIENVALRQQRKNLTNLLNITLTEKARNDWDLMNLRYYCNISSLIIQDLERARGQCNTELIACKLRMPCDCAIRPFSVPITENSNCPLVVEQLRARLQLVESNFTQTAQRMRMEMDQITKERDYINLQAIHQRREKTTQEKELQLCREKSKGDFFQSLRGVSNVSKAFLLKIESLFPAHIAFQLTCPKQREHLEQIRTNCTSLSREVEDKLQHYLNSVGVQVSDIQAENNRLKAENWRLSEDYRWCTQNRSGLIQEHKQNLDSLQRKHDQDKERLLVDKMRLNGEIDVLQNNVKYKNKEAEHLREQIKHLNMSCVSKTGLGGFGGGSNSRIGTSSQPGWSLGGLGASSSSAGGGQLGRTGSGGLGSSFGSSGSAFSKPGSTGTGSSSSSFLSPGSSPSLSSTGSGFNKPGSTGTGSSSSSFLSPGSSPSLSSTGSGFNKPGSTGTGSSSSSFLSPGSSPSLSSTGSGFNKPGSTGTGSSSSSFLSPGSSPSLSSTGLGFNKPGSTGGAFSNFGSAGSSPSLSSTGIGSNKPALSARGSSTTGSASGSSLNLGSTGIGSNKPTSSMKSSPGSSSGSPGSTSKTSSASSGFSWLGFGNSNSGQSKIGTSGTGKATSGTGSVFGAGKPNGLGGQASGITQHLQMIQQLINPSDPNDKQEVSRMVG